MSSSAAGRITRLANMHPENEALLTDFAIGSSDLRKEHEAWIGELGRRLLYYEANVGIGTWDVMAIGYASQTGDREYNRNLSRARAEAAIDYYAGLIHRPRNMRLRFLGMGEDHPVDPNIQENARDRCVHFAVGLGRVIVPQPPKDMTIDLAEMARKEMNRRSPFEIQVEEAQEFGFGISNKIGMGAGYSTLRINFRVRNPRTNERHDFTFMGSGGSVGISTPSPLPVDGMWTRGLGPVDTVLVHDSITDVWRHFTGEAQVIVLGEPVFLLFRNRTGFAENGFELKLPTQIQLPSLNFKQFEGRVRQGRLR